MVQSKDFIYDASEKNKPHAEHRLRERQRVNDSRTLAAKHPQLKPLSAELAYRDHEEAARRSSMKYTFNLDAARSVFRFECPNRACVGGDFDLSQDLANAIAARRAMVIGELPCQGWRNSTTIATEHCPSILRYKLRLSFAPGKRRLAGG